MNDFNFVAPFYDSLSKLVFGQSLIRAQSYFLPEITKHSTVLLIGGGTGKILEQLHCKEITYLEKSSRMIAKAKMRRTKSPITFVQHDVLNWSSEQRFDFILCPFILDCFEAPNLRKVLTFCRESLKTGGQLIVTDFRNNGKNQSLISTMYMFFKLTSSIEASRLLPLERVVAEMGFSRLKRRYFFSNSVFSALYCLPGLKKASSPISAL